MHQLLENIFKKKGINSVAELNSDEKAYFEKYKNMTDRLHQLETEVITVDGIMKFCRQEKEAIEKEWQDSCELSDKKEIYLKVQHKIYDSLIKYIESPKQERDNIINYLEGLAK